MDIDRQANVQGTEAPARRIVVFGATGGVGREVVAQALQQGLEVVAYARTPSKLGRTDEHLTVVQGELDDAAKIREAISGTDAVISALGPSLDRKATGKPLVTGTRLIVEAMQAEGVSRFIGMATPSLRDGRDRPSMLGRIVPFMGRTFLRRAFDELLELSAIVASSDLDWTIARFTRPVDGPVTGKVRSGFLGVDKVGATIRRADIAFFLLHQVDDERYRRAAPAISN